MEACSFHVLAQVVCVLVTLQPLSNESRIRVGKDGVGDKDRKGFSLNFNGLFFH
jgi:hypothetical protein